jgi:TPR repeat protein
MHLKMKDFINKALWSLSMRLAKVFSKAPFNSVFAKEMLSSGYLGIGYRSIKSKNYRRARRYFEKVVELNVGEQSLNSANEHLGMLYENGWGVDKDLDLAEKYYLQAGTRGDRAYIHKVAIRSQIQKHDNA